jgi:hypothetical protein
VVVPPAGAPDGSASVRPQAQRTIVVTPSRYHSASQSGQRISGRTRARIGSGSIQRRSPHQWQITSAPPSSLIIRSRSSGVKYASASSAFSSLQRQRKASGNASRVSSSSSSPQVSSSIASSSEP